MTPAGTRHGLSWPPFTGVTTQCAVAWCNARLHQLPGHRFKSVKSFQRHANWHAAPLLLPTTSLAEVREAVAASTAATIKLVSDEAATEGWVEDAALKVAAEQPGAPEFRGYQRVGDEMGGGGAVPGPTGPQPLSPTAALRQQMSIGMIVEQTNHYIKIRHAARTIRRAVKRFALAFLLA